ncbi:MAG: DoxX family protein [Acidobacteria bacterium]|nr:DoxX family protein [Acidobacteriota bacterium]
MIRKVLRTESDYLQTVLRLILGIVFFAHGAQKVLGWFGGAGLQATTQFFAGMNIPAPLAYLAIAAEFLGGLGLIVGLLGRVAAFGIFCNMAVAVFLVHLPNGFFMNWTGSQPGEGFEYHLLALALSLGIMVRGSGALSLDQALTRKRPIGLRV